MGENSCPSDCLESDCVINLVQEMYFRNYVIDGVVLVQYLGCFGSIPRLFCFNTQVVWFNTQVVLLQYLGCFDSKPRLFWFNTQVVSVQYLGCFGSIHRLFRFNTQVQYLGSIPRLLRFNTLFQYLGCFGSINIGCFGSIPRLFWLNTQGQYLRCFSSIPRFFWFNTKIFSVQYLGYLGSTHKVLSFAQYHANAICEMPKFSLRRNYNRPRR